MGGGRTYVYNALGQQVEWSNLGFDFLYDKDGRWVYFVNEIDGSQTYSEIPFLGGRYLASYRSDGTHLTHANLLGSTTMETNAPGGVMEDLLFYPWGQFWQQTAATGWSFASMPYRDQPLGHDLTPNRIYDYNTAPGRWLSPDPLAGDIMNPQSLNRYLYVLNNPTSLIDPLGLRDCTKDPNPRACWLETYWGLGNSINPYVNPLSDGLNWQQTYLCAAGGDCTYYFNFDAAWLAVVGSSRNSSAVSDQSGQNLPPCGSIFSLVNPATGNDLPLRVTTDFGAVDASHITPHAGIDFAAPNGTELVLNTEGQVMFPRGYHDGFGNTLTVATGFGEFLFAHLQSNPLYLVGQFIDPKSAVAFTGNTGYSTGPHLHVELHTPGTALDYMSGRINKGNIVQPCKP